jgi:hypothetical protein
MQAFYHHFSCLVDYKSTSSQKWDNFSRRGAEFAEKNSIKIPGVKAKTQMS